MEILAFRNLSKRLFFMVLMFTRKKFNGNIYTCMIMDFFRGHTSNDERDGDRMNQNRPAFGQNNGQNAGPQNPGWNTAGGQGYDPRQTWSPYGQNQQYGTQMSGYQQNSGMQPYPWQTQGQQMPQPNGQQAAYQPFGGMNAGQQGGYNTQNPGRNMFPNAFNGGWQNNQGGSYQQGQPENGGNYSQQNPQYNGMPGNTMQPPFAGNYSQMGRNQGTARQTAAQLQQNGYTNGYMPQNQMAGGGFVTQNPGQGAARSAFQFDNVKLILLSVILLALFVLGVLVHITALKWIFAALALAAIVLFWVRPLIDTNKRLCFTVVFGLLLILALIPFGNGAPDKQTNPGNQPPATVVVNNRGGTENNGQSGMQNNGSPVNPVTEAPQPAVPTPGPADDIDTTEQLRSFFYFWSVNKEDEMLSLCAPSWQNSVDSPKTALFGIKANRTPLDYTIEKVSGTGEDSTRTVTLTSQMDRNNGKAPQKYRLNVLMVKEGGIWYVDPSSLKSYDPVETTEAVTATATPTIQPVNSKTVLYYNPDGGSKYHLDPNCQSTNKRYLPLKGQFTYDQLNDEKYAKLQPCNVCDAPVR